MSTRLELFIAPWFIRSQLEYGSVVWSPFSARNIMNLERVQRHATKFILKTEDDYDISNSKLNLLSLEHRRFHFDVLHVNGYNINNFFCI